MTTPAYSPRYAEQGSPIAAFSITLRTLVANQALLNLNSMAALGTGWNTFMRDLGMLIREGTTLGCITPWVRRVAAHMLKAQAVLDSNDGDEATRVYIAKGILQKLANADDVLLGKCLQWMEERFPKEEKPHAP